ncbi:MAG: DNA polymerase III subunit delta' [Rhodospirillales bacterium]|jgi:DNA polymerase-3 subunit delta'|nr:DNA polymerase III subunit delta' [Rhodospirillales bacterium]
MTAIAETDTVDGQAGMPPPRQNPDLIGHEAAERTLLDAYRSERLSHAWLICGPRGIGKATLAYRFARFLLGRGRPASGGLFGNLPADDPETLYVDPANPLFHRVAGGGHADLMVVERGFTDDTRQKMRTEIVVADVRRIGGFLGMTPAEGGWRVVVIDAADEMNPSAMNAVLKVLEEPPPQSVLLLVCHNPGRLLPTVRSRCRRLVLNPLPSTAVAGLLTRYEPGLDVADALALASLAEGSVGRALALAGEGGLSLYRELLGLLSTLPNIDIAALHEFADRLSRPSADSAFRTVTELLQNWLGRLIRAGAVATMGDGAPNDAESALTARLLAAGGLERWLEVWEKTTILLARTDGANLDRKSVILHAVLTIDKAARG